MNRIGERITSGALALISLAAFPASGEVTWRGQFAAEYRYFPKEPLDPRQRNGYPSIMVQPEFYVDWDEGRQSLTGVPFYRWDRYDENRTHGDIRELYWLYVGDGFEALVGINRVNWSVTESQHLVNIINQIDLVENPDREDLLGQPMFSTKVYTPVGTWDMFVLPYFRERTFPGPVGRLRTSPRFNTDADALYESVRKQEHIDYALRWSQTFGAWDMGLVHFYGTNRDPLPVPSTTSEGEPVLLPFYELIHQTGADVQAALENWLLKLEAIRRSSNTDVFGAATIGFEYTFFAVRESTLDIGLVAEYLYDSRGAKALTPFEDDILLGLRLRPNDVQDTLFLLSVIADRDTPARVFSLEASRRLTDNFRLSIEARVFDRLQPDAPFYSLRQDDYLQLELAYHF
jgi:hypothetical protein